MHEKGEQKELVSTVLYSIVFALTLTVLIYSVYMFPPNEKMGFFEKQQAISTNFKLVLFLGVISMTMLVSLMMLLTNVFMADQSTAKATLNRIDSRVKEDLKQEVKKIKKELDTLKDNKSIKQKPFKS